MITVLITEGDNMKQVISCSRRTDIPAFYYEWLQKVLQEKSVTLVNSFNDKEYTVDLDPEKVHSIVLWSKDFSNVLKHPGLLENYKLYFQYTITGRGGSQFEPNVPSWHQSIEKLSRLANRYGGDAINWRFDPLFVEKGHEFKKLVSAFQTIAQHVATIGVTRCTISFIEFYGKVKNRLNDRKIYLDELSEDTKIELSQQIVDCAKTLGLKVHMCAQEFESKVNGGDCLGCIDGHILTDLYGGKVSLAKDSSQRKLCKCTKSIDIGSYKNQPCEFKCAYCYANG